MTMVFAVPPIARALARHPMVNRFDLSSLRLVMLSAAPCPAELELECEARLGCTVGQALGMTEGAPVSLPSEPVCHGSAGLLAASAEAIVVDPDSGERVGPGGDGRAVGPRPAGHPRLPRRRGRDAHGDRRRRLAAQRRPRALRRGRSSVRRRPSPQGAHQGARLSRGPGAARGRADRAPDGGRRRRRPASRRGVRRGPGGLRLAARGRRAVPRSPCGWPSAWRHTSGSPT